MRLGIGIDTGGTYTDAVIYDFNEKKVLSSAKALTTKENLSIGINGALRALDSSLLTKAQVAALSTTLATNACVEGKGGRAKLIFIGLDGLTLERVGGSYGLGRLDELFFCGGSGSFDGKVLPNPDWDRLLADTKEWLSDADGLGIVELYSMNNGAVAEREAKRLFSKLYDIPIVCGSELFTGLNSVQRGSGTLLNAKLVPIIKEFLSAIKSSFSEFGIKAPIVIVRSDGSLMSEEFSKLRPVETVLCGPAASILGGMELAKNKDGGIKDSIIVDMGGTTTDISIVKNSRPIRARDGISIGSWKTFVKGVFIDTFGLGGDSAVRHEGSGFRIEKDRVIPLSLLAKQHPKIKDDLRELLSSNLSHSKPIHEFYTLVKDITGKQGWTEEEKSFCRALKDGPLILRKAAEALGTDIYRMNVKRLETEGIVLRAGLTPTDIMHIKGDFNVYDKEAALLGARFVLRCMDLDDLNPKKVESFCDDIYNRVKKTLYKNIVRILLQDRYPVLRRDGLNPQLEQLISLRWDEIQAGTGGIFSNEFVTSAALVGIGAPIHIFLPDVAKALNTVCIIPENAAVANAVGAVVGNIAAAVEVEVRPNHTPSGIKGFFVSTSEDNLYVDSRDDAVKLARERASSLALIEARERGVTGDIKVDVEEENYTGQAMREQTVDLGTKVTATAFGGAVL
jgi:N-methylhydantoinase A/oxoprolinase/acetone carboxylase beta subunit